MRIATALTIAILWSAPFAVAQKLEFQLDSLAAKAKEKVELDFDGAMVAQAAKMNKQIAEYASAIKEVHVRHYEFAEAGKYTDDDLESIRKQTSSGSGWSRIVNVKDEKEHVEVLVQSHDGKPSGFLVIAAEPKELSVAYVVGEVPLDKVSELVNSAVKYDMKHLIPEGKGGDDKSGEKQ
jgi:hypothetical protein